MAIRWGKASYQKEFEGIDANVSGYWQLATMLSLHFWSLVKFHKYLAVRFQVIDCIHFKIIVNFVRSLREIKD